MPLDHPPRPQVILVKHLHDRNSPADRFNMLVVTETEAWIGQRPLYAFRGIRSASAT